MILGSYRKRDFPLFQPSAHQPHSHFEFILAFYDLLMRVLDSEDWTGLDWTREEKERETE